MQSLFFFPRRGMRLRRSVTRFFTNRTVKDRLFRAIFTRDKTALLQLYNALHDTNYTNTEDLEIVTIENIVYMSMKNDLAFIICGVMNLYEHQSSFNPNMPVRFLIYLAEEYQKYIAGRKYNIYGSKLILLPTPQCVVFYNGNREEPDEQLLRLSEAFGNKNVKSDIDLTVHMLNINFDHNKNLMQKCHRLWEYSYLVEQIKSNLALGLRQHEAIDRAVTHCIDNHILADFLEENRMEVLGMLLTEYNERKVMRALKKEAIEDGRAEGRIEGRIEGRAEATSDINRLNQLLIRDNRMDDLVRAASDPEFQRRLMEQYQIR